MITLDFSKRQSLKVWAKEYDTARELNVQCIKDYVPIDITNCIITLNALKKDGTYIYNNGEIQDATNGKVTIPMTNQLLAVVGEVKADVSIYYPNGTILTSSSFTFDIDETIRNDEAIESSSEFTELTKAIITESNRVLAENGRVSAEQTRVNNETIRNNAENIRVDNESDRISAESGRVTAENERVTSETSRVNAENNRINAETSRVSAESSRVTAENNRVSAETARVDAETLRVEAEDSRATAETARQTGYSQMLEQINQLNETNVNLSTQLADTAQQIEDLDTTKATKVELTNAVANEKSERQAEIAVERARIDSFTALAEGSTTGDAELIDARIGADGITYANVGTAVRGQVSQLNNDVVDIKDKYIGDIRAWKELVFVLNEGKYAYASPEASAPDGTIQTYNQGCHSGLIPVKEGDKFKVSGRGQLNVPIAVFYSAGSATHANFVGAYERLSSEKIYRNEAIEIPANVSHVIFNSSKYDQYPLVVIKYDTNAIEYELDELREEISEIEEEVSEIEAINRKAFNYYATYNNGILRIGKKYAPTYDFIIEMSAYLPNSLFEFGGFLKIGNQNDFVSDDIDNGESISRTRTDWVSPYKFKAVNNADGWDVDGLRFSGGAHNAEGAGSQSGQPSATMTNLVILIDGVEKESFNGYCNRVDVYREAEVQASNTTKLDGSGRACLKETVHWIFNNGSIDVEVTLTAKESIDFYLAYGLQMYANNNTGMRVEKLSFNGSKSNRAMQQLATVNSGDKNCRETQLTGDENVMVSNIDLFDLGDFEYNRATQYSSFMVMYAENGGKTYYNLVNISSEGVPIRLLSGECLRYKGSYKFLYNN